jgi:hypothetical protein
MSATIETRDGLLVLRISGCLRKAELDAARAGAVAGWGPDTRAKVLVLAGGFTGWDRNDDWDDISFAAVYGRRFDKIAIVAEARWETELLMFTGAGIRRTTVRFFTPDQERQARAWLTEADAEQD